MPCGVVCGVISGVLVGVAFLPCVEVFPGYFRFGWGWYNIDLLVWC